MNTRKQIKIPFQSKCQISDYTKYHKLRFEIFITIDRLTVSMIVKMMQKSFPFAVAGVILPYPIVVATVPAKKKEL